MLGGTFAEDLQAVAAFNEALADLDQPLELDDSDWRKVSQLWLEKPRSITAPRWANQQPSLRSIRPTAPSKPRISALTLSTRFKVAWAPSKDEGVDHAHRLWPNSGLPGELAQVLPSPRHFEQASELVTREAIAGSTPCGPDPQTHRDAYQPFLETGFDEIYVGNMGPHYAEMIRAYGAEVLPALRSVPSGR